MPDSATPIELTIRGARERLADRQPLWRIDTPQYVFLYLILMHCVGALLQRCQLSVPENVFSRV